MGSVDFSFLDNEFASLSREELLAKCEEFLNKKNNKVEEKPLEPLLEAKGNEIIKIYEEELKSLYQPYYEEIQGINDILSNTSFIQIANDDKLLDDLDARIDKIINIDNNEKSDFIKCNLSSKEFQRQIYELYNQTLDKSIMFEEFKNDFDKLSQSQKFNKDITRISYNRSDDLTAKVDDILYRLNHPKEYEMQKQVEKPKTNEMMKNKSDNTLER